MAGQRVKGVAFTIKQNLLETVNSSKILHRTVDKLSLFVFFFYEKDQILF